MDGPCGICDFCQGEDGEKIAFISNSDCRRGWADLFGDEDSVEDLVDLVCSERQKKEVA
jgi:hypothetical protein